MFFSKRLTPVEKLHNPGNFTVLRPPVAGEPVTNETAFRFSSFYACVRIISETIGYLPWRVHERDGSKRIAANTHPLDLVLHTRPNPEMPPFYFKELIAQRLVARGNFYAEIERNRMGDIVALWPILNDCVDVKRDARGAIIYDIRSTSGGQNVALSADDVFHVRGSSADGLVGRSVIDLARESISLGLAAQAFGAGFLGNGAVPSMIITNKDGKAGLDQEGVKNLLTTWNKNNRGSRKMGRTEYLDKGLDIQVIGVTPANAQFIETANYSIFEMCRWFRIPPHKLANLERSTHNNIESQNIEFVTDAILPNVSRIEASANFSLFDEADAARFYTKFNIMGLLRGDSKARTEFYKYMQGMGNFDINEVRELEDLDPLEDEQNLRMVPVNMTTVERMKSGQIGGQSTASALLVDACVKLCKIELNTVKKYTISTERQQIIDFYVDHARRSAEDLRKICCLILELNCQKTANIDKILMQFCGDMASQSADDLHHSICADKKPALLASWESNKAHKMAQKLLEALQNV